MTTVSSMIFIMRMSVVNVRTRKEGLYIHDIDVIEMEPVLTWNCNSSKMTSWRPSAFWITTIFTSPQRDCTWVMRNFDVFVVVGSNYQLDKQSSCRWFETLLHSCDVHAISFSWCHYMMLSGRIPRGGGGGGGGYSSSSRAGRLGRTLVTSKFYIRGGDWKRGSKF